MGLLYVNENGAQIGYEANKCVVNYKDGLKKLIPIESLEGITIMGQSQMTAKCTEECLKRGIPVVYFSKGGVYFGRVMSTSHINAKEFNESLQDPDNDHERIVRLFGSAKKGNVKRSRLLFSDMVLANEGELRRAGLQSMTEVKFENSISRLTAVANPRQIERAVRGSIFELDLIYEVEDEKEMIEDVETLAEGMRLLQYDYIGGSGSRGYGKIAFENIIAETVVGEVSEELLAQCNKILSQAIQE